MRFGGLRRRLKRADRQTAALAGLGGAALAAPAQQAIARALQQPARQPASQEELTTGARYAHLLRA